MVSLNSKIRNIIFLINILFVTIYTNPTTIIKTDNIGLLFNINDLRAIGYIEIDPEIRNELIQSFDGCIIQSGENIFRNFVDILFFIIIDAAIGNEDNFLKRNINLSKLLLHDSTPYIELIEAFKKNLMEEYCKKDLVSVHKFLFTFIDSAKASDDLAKIISNINLANCQFYDKSSIL